MSTFTWTNTAGGDWSAAADWSSAPISSSDLAITLPGIYTVTASAPQTAQSLVVDDPGATLVLDASLTVANGFTLQAGTIVFEGSTLSVGTFEQDGGLITGNTVDIVATGTMAFDGGTISATDVINLTAGAISQFNSVSLGSNTDLGGTEIAAPGALIEDGSGTQTQIIYAAAENGFTWTNMAGGDWSVGGNWSGDIAPAATDDALITLPGSYTVTQSGTSAAADVLLDDAAGTLAVDGVLNAGTLTVDAGVLAVAGTLADTTVLDTGPALQPNYGGGTLSDVTWRGTLNIVGAPPSFFSVLDIANGLTVTGADGVSPGVINDYYADDIRVLDNETFDNVTWTLAGGGPLLTAPNITFGSHATLNVYGGDADYLTFQTLVTNGTVILGSGDQIVTTSAFTNTGVWGVGDGASVSLQVNGAFLNSGVIYVAAGTSLDISATTFGPGDLGELLALGRIVLNGTLDNVGNTISLTSGGSLDQVSLDGVLLGGTVVAQGGTLFGDNTGDGRTTTLQGVTWIGPFNVVGNWYVDAATRFQAAGGGPETFNLEGGLDGGSLIFTGPRVLNDLVVNAIGFSVIGVTSGSLTLGPSVSVTASSEPGVFSELSFTGSVVNQGSIRATGSNEVLSLGASFTNAGWIGVENGASVAVGADGEFNGGLNSGTIALGDATTALDVGGIQTPAGLGTITSSGGQIVIAGTLDNTGNTLVIAPGSGFANLAFESGMLQAGTVLNQGGAIDFANATLSDLTWVGPLDLASAGSAGASLNDVIVQAPGGGPGTVTLNDTDLYVTGSGTLDGMTLNASGSFDTISDGRIYSPTTGTVTLGPTAVLNAVAGGTDVVLQAATAVVNDGTINVAGTGEILAVQAPNFINANLVNVASNGVFLAGATVAYPTIPPGAFENAGDIAIASDGTFDVGPNETSYTNLGTISFADPTSTLELNGTATATALGDFSGAGQLVVGGLLDNTGNTLDIGPAGSFDVLQLGAGDFAFSAGVIQGGTIVVQGGTAVFDSGTLDDVVWVGPLVIGGQSASNELLVENGFQVEPNGDGRRIVTLTGAGIAALDFVDSETLNNVSLTASAQINDVGSSATLTFDSATTIVVAPGTTEVLMLNAVTLVNGGLIADTSATDSFVTVTGTSFVNDGTIEVSGPTNGLVVQPASFLNAGQVSITDGAAFYLDVPQQPVETYSQTVGTFSNTGTIAIDATSTLILGGTLTQASFADFATSGGLIELAGTLLNAGDTLLVAPHTQFGNLLLGETVPGGPSFIGAPAGTIQGGTVIDQGGSLTILSATLDGVTWQAPVDLTQAYARLEVVDGTTLEALPGNSRALINLTGLGSSIGFDTETLTNTSVTLGALGGSVTFSGPTTPLFSILGPGGTVEPPPQLTLAAGTTLTAATPGASMINLAGNITNDGLINDADGNVTLGFFTPSYNFGDDGGGVVIVEPYLTSDAIFDNQGTVLAEAGTGSTFTIGDLTTLTNEGLVRIDNGDDLVVQTSTFDNTGTFAVGTGTIEFAATIANTGTIAFTPGDAGVVIFETPNLDETGPIINLGTGDRIEFGDGIGVFAADVTAPGMVTVMTSIGSIILSGVSFTAGTTQSFTTGIDSATGDGYITPTGTSATQAAPCFAAGTRIATENGEVDIETIRVGDMVRTLLGDTLTPITWVGRREVDCARHPHPRKVWPVRIAAGAFGSNRPHTDLFLSPDHAVYVNRVLIPIKHLINGSTITQAPTDQVTYHHLELPAHDVLLAEGLPAESFLDLRDGSNYANRPGPIRLYPDYSARMWEAFGCARLVVTGPELQAARALVAAAASARAAA